jgi:hypothetical protein
LSRVTLLKFSFNRRTSCSRALIYSSFRSRWVLYGVNYGQGASARLGLPLSLSIQFLSPCQCRLAVWLRTSSLRGLAINCTRMSVRCIIVRNKIDLPRVVFFSVKVLRNPRLMESGLFALSDWPLPYPLPPDLLPY